MDTYFVIIDFNGHYRRFVFDINFEIYKSTKDRAMELIDNYLNNINKPCAVGIKYYNKIHYFEYGNHGINCEILSKELNTLEDNFNKKQKASVGDIYFSSAYRFNSKKMHDGIIYTTFYQAYCDECDDFRDELLEIKSFMLLNDTKKLKDDLDVLFAKLEFLFKKIH